MFPVCSVFPRGDLLSKKSLTTESTEITEANPFRQGNALAEGQKSADVKHILTPPAPSPAEMARGSLAPEENASF
jgi:hypothetical protein